MWAVDVAGRKLILLGTNVSCIILLYLLSRVHSAPDNSNVYSAVPSTSSLYGVLIYMAEHLDSPAFTGLQVSSTDSFSILNELGPLS